MLFIYFYFIYLFFFFLVENIKKNLVRLIKRFIFFSCSGEYLVNYAAEIVNFLLS